MKNDKRNGRLNMPLTKNKLRTIIRSILKEANYIPFNGGSGGGGNMGGGGGGYGGGGDDIKDLATFKKEISSAVATNGGQIESISIIDPNDLEDEYGHISDTIHDEINGKESNVIYNNFGKQPYQDNIEDIFNEKGPGALKHLLKWLNVDFDYSEDQIFETDDSISAYYVSKNGGGERQITILFTI